MNELTNKKKEKDKNSKKQKQFSKNTGKSDDEKQEKVVTSFYRN